MQSLTEVHNMAFKYNLSVHELMDFFCEQEYEGFTEQEIRAVEHRIGAKLPKAYRDFLLKYGEKGIYDAFDNLYNFLEDIITSYQIIDDIIDNLEEDFKDAIEYGNEEEYADNPYFSLWQLPREEWHTITQNYVLIGCDREGIVYEGYLLEDLLAGNPDPPLYLSLNDDFIEYKKWTDSTEPFLTEMIGETAFGHYNCDSYDSDRIASGNKTSIKELFTQIGADIDDRQLNVYGHIGTCFDTVSKTVYFYFEYERFQRVLRATKEDMF